MQTLAIIKAGVVVNVVLADSMPPEALQAIGADLAVDVTDTDPRPGPGWTHDGAAFAPPAPETGPAWSDPGLDPRYWWVDVGPFFDRFGVKALAVTSSTDPQVQGLVTLIQPRKYVDLKRPDLPGMLDLLIGKGLIAAADKQAILTTPTTDYERHIKGMPQPI